MKQFVCIFLLLLIPSFSLAETATDALRALQKLEVRLDSGIIYRDYPPALADTVFTVKMYLESPEAKKNPELVAQISKTIKHFENYNHYWPVKIESPEGPHFVE